MSAIIPWCHVIGIHTEKLSKEESLYLEAALFLRICQELQLMFKAQYQNYFYLTHFSMEMECAMLEANFVRLIVADILASEAYTSSGLAYYTETPEEVICEIVTGRNTRPSAVFLCKLLTLHHEVKRDLYEDIKRKILADYVGEE